MKPKKISSFFDVRTNQCLSIPQKQISLDKKPLKQNKNFIRALFTSKIKGARTWFDKLDCNKSLAREIDPEMSLEKFLSRNVIDSVKLQIGSPVQEQIRFCAIYTDENKIYRFAWFECPLTKKNYNIVSKIFKSMYGHEV